MKITKLYTQNNKSYFEDIDSGATTRENLGHDSKAYPVNGMIFRDFESDLVYERHNAPQIQYIIYLEGEVEVEASGGEKRIFKAGDVLLAMDLEGEGHITRTLTKGRSIVVKV